ncbi:MAG: hypothetical protein ACOC0N_09315 [Chroococcales cyanobacterium]
MIEQKVVKIIKELIKQEKPELLQLTKVPYQSPSYYSNWSSEVLAFLAKSFDPYSPIDKVSNYAIYVACSLVDYYFPTYYVSRELALALWNTRSELHASELNMALPAVMFMIPYNTIFTPDGDSLSTVGIASSRKSERLRQVYEKSGDCLIGASGFLKDELTNSYWYGFHNKSCALGNPVEDSYKEYSLNHLGELTNLEQENEVTFLNKFRAFCFNLMFVLEKRPELITEEVNQPKGFGTQQKTNKFKTPVWLGKEYRIKYISETQSNDTSTGKGSPKCTHFRKGHFRRQKWGKNREKEKLIWIDPVMVNIE